MNPFPFAIAQAALQQSIGDPPPSATAKSAPVSRITETQASTFSVVGFGRISLNTALILPSEFLTNSAASPFFSKLLPQTSTPILPPISSIYFPRFFLLPQPNTSLTGRLNSHCIVLLLFMFSVKYYFITNDLHLQVAKSQTILYNVNSMLIY